MSTERTWERRTIAAKGLQSLGFRGAEILTQALLIAVTARFLGPSGRGLYALAALASVIFALPLGSVWSTLALDLARGRRPLAGLVTTALVISAAGGCAVAVVGLLVSILFGAHWWVIAFPALITPALVFLTYAQGFYQALGHVAAFHTVRVARIAGPLVFVSAALLAGAGIRGIIAAWALSFVVLVPPVLVHLVRVSGRPTLPDLSAGEYVRALAVGARFLPGNAALALDLRVALPLLAMLSTTAVVGVYSVAVSVAELVRLGSRSIYIGTFADIGSREREAAAALTARAVRHSLLLALVASLAVVPAAKLLLPPVVGPGYGDVPLLLALLLPGIAALAAFPTLTAFFSVQDGRPETVTVASMLLVGVSAACMLLLVGPFGASGAAVASSIGALVGAGFLARAFLKATSMSVAAVVPGRSETNDYLRLGRTLAQRRPTLLRAPARTGDA
jgi:O-antigen/teichoic acid export membrane protein